MPKFCDKPALASNIITHESGPIEKFLDKIFLEAISLGASDIHFENFEKTFVIRYRVNGLLTTLDGCDQEIAGPVFSRIKVLANLNIAEARLPQDGSICYCRAGRNIEFRVSCVPTQFGESIVLRVLNNWCDAFSLKNLLAGHDELVNFLGNIAERSGLTLFVGPTGCGKSTTLYSVLREIRSDTLKILSCEDPVEQRLDGVSQSNINASIGFSFAAAVRAFLRHDPDVIFIGEIRDKETADLAVRAAITGHCVLSTLHANDAASAVPRLVDLGVDRTLIAEALLCVVYQQLENVEVEAAETSEFYHAHAPRKWEGPASLARRLQLDVLFVDREKKAAIKSGT